MNRKKTIRLALMIAGIGVIIAAAIAYYMFNQPHRDVQATKSDFGFTASEIVNEYLADSKKANDKYLDVEGESKVLEILGEVSAITEDFNKQKVVLLKSKADSAGVSCTFTAETNASVNQIKVGENITVKGVIRSGAAFDKDLGMYENVTMEKCSVVLK